MTGDRASLGETIAAWRDALLHPMEAGAILRGTAGGGRHFDAALAGGTAVMFAVYGFGMGLFTGVYAAAVSAAKITALYGLSLAVLALPAYVQNHLFGPGLPVRSVMRLGLLGLSAHALVLASFSPVAWFFTLTTSQDSYHVLVAVHLGAIAVAGFVGAVVTAALWRAAVPAGAVVRRAWLPGAGLAILSAGVYIHLWWVFRPWLGSPGGAYAPFRPLGDSPFDAFGRFLGALLQQG